MQQNEGQLQLLVGLPQGEDQVRQKLVYFSTIFMKSSLYVISIICQQKLILSLYVNSAIKNLHNDNKT